MSCEQNNLLLQSLELVRDGVGKLSGEHKDIHGSISKVGRAIDRVSAFSIFRFLLSILEDTAGLGVWDAVVFSLFQLVIN